MTKLIRERHFLCPLAAIGALVRHEVFNTLSNGLVNFDVPPVFFWSLTTYLDNTGFTVETRPAR